MAENEIGKTPENTLRNPLFYILKKPKRSLSSGYQETAGYVSWRCSSYKQRLLCLWQKTRGAFTAITW